LAMRCARDSMPPLRLLLLEYLAMCPSMGMTIAEIWRGMNMPRTSVRRQVDALHALGLVTVQEIKKSDDQDNEDDGTKGDRPDSEWRYSLAEDVDPRVVGWGEFVEPRM
jgi:predicted ArsR family transcriptional regulator